MAKISKEDRKSRIRQWRAEGRSELAASMPLSPHQLDSLLDYLDANLTSCDHSTKLTDIFLHVEKLDKQRVLSWLADHGGFCDCEVLYNLHDLAELFHDRPTPPTPRPKKQRAARALTTVTGWNLTNLPSPWRIANLCEPEEPVQIQLGKKAGCTIAIVESPLPPGDQLSDDYWSQLWYARTQLPNKPPIHVMHAVLDFPIILRSTLVRSPNWTPVYCWIVPEVSSWYLEVLTEHDRYQGDLPQIAQLIKQLGGT